MKIIVTLSEQPCLVSKVTPDISQNYIRTFYWIMYDSSKAGIGLSSSCKCLLCVFSTSYLIFLDLCADNWIHIFINVLNVFGSVVVVGWSPWKRADTSRSLYGLACIDYSAVTKSLKGMVIINKTYIEILRLFFRGKPITYSYRFSNSIYSHRILTVDIHRVLYHGWTAAFLVRRTVAKSDQKLGLRNHRLQIFKVNS